MKKYGPFLVLLVLLAVASLALAFTVDVSLVDKPGVRMELPKTLGEWTCNELRYCHNAKCKKDFRASELNPDDPEHCPSCADTLFNMSKEEYDALPKDTLFLKGCYSNPDGKEVFVSIVLSGRERESIHRPQRCLTGQGHEIRSSHVLNVPLQDGSTTQIMVLDCAKEYKTTQGTPAEFRSYYAYWFVGQGRETPYHLTRMFWLAWDRIVKGVAHKWAYIAISGSIKEGEGKVEYESVIKEFVGLLHRPLVMAKGEKADAL